MISLIRSVLELILLCNTRICSWNACNVPINGTVFFLMFSFRRVFIFYFYNIKNVLQINCSIHLIDVKLYFWTLDSIRSLVNNLCTQ